ncbi:helix-turn-helix domain-containing protein [Streptomyces sp. NPDC006386]|uniref:TetR/AcrR family transcriptional regulator n=1 Tax=Streptomyces sp. NPDC006386 TaxID=3156762 RepID=UPI0033A2671F
MGGTMDGTRQRRRGDTRRRIQDVALDLFAEQGYEKTSLREIAERLDVTKAALYYHFKTKEEILVSIFEDLTQPIEDLIDWGRRQPHTLETKQEIIRRYADTLAQAAPLFRFMHDNQASVRDLRIGESFKARVHSLRETTAAPPAAPPPHPRCASAIFTLHAGMFLLQDVGDDPEERNKAVLEVATDLVTQAHRGTRGS